MNVPITFPSSFLATDSQSCTAISAATFFALRKSEKREELALPRRLHTPDTGIKDGVRVQDPHKTTPLPLLLMRC